MSCACSTLALQFLMPPTEEQALRTYDRYRPVPPRRSKKTSEPQTLSAVSRFIEFFPDGNAGSSGGIFSGSVVMRWSPSL